MVRSASAPATKSASAAAADRQNRQRHQARLALRQRKADEQFNEFVRQTRDRAYVEIKADER